MILLAKIPGAGSPILLTIEGGKISRIEPIEREERCDLGGPDFFVQTGFFDPQVNGFGGVDFNQRDLRVEEVSQAVRSIASSGVTHFFPTLITASHERLVRQLKILTEALEADALASSMCPGIHLEGPYINPQDGPRGAHPRDFIRPPDWEEFLKFQDVCGGRIKLVTLAPEMERAIPFIEKALAREVVVGIGHSNADEETIGAAVRAGARLSCHLGNGTDAILPRHRNIIQKQLAMDELMASIITDGVHLPDYVVKNFVRAKGVERIVLSTDCMAGAAAPPGHYTLGDLKVEVEEDRTARLSGTPYLAGSTLTMDRAVENVMLFSNIDLPVALNMASHNGRKIFPGLEREIGVSRPADLVLFEYRDKLVIRGTFVSGERVY